jgi:hypothetical protein
MNRREAVGRAVALTALVFGLLVWGYVVLIQVTHPDWVAAPFSHIGVFPFDQRLDEMGMAGFAVAAIGFLFWRLQVNMKSA